LQNPASQPEQAPVTQNPTTQPEQNNQNIVDDKTINPDPVVDQPETVTNPVNDAPQTAPKKEIEEQPAVPVVTEAPVQESKFVETPVQAAPAVEQKQESLKEEKVVIPPAEVKTETSSQKTETAPVTPTVNNALGDKLPS